MITRTITSFLIVLMAYGIYSAVANPWVEPPVQHAVPAARDSQSFGRDPILEKYQSYLRSGSWERKNPKVLRTQGAIVLWQENATLDDGSLELSPCTVIYDSAEKGKDKQDGPIVLEAPEGARLRFDKPLNPKQISVDVGKLVGGILDGPIHIYRPGARGDQKLDIETSNVRVNERRLWTPDPVRFQLGEHRGSGRDLLIQFLESKQAGELDFVELGHLEQVELAVRQAGSLFGPRPGGQMPALVPSQKTRPGAKVPVFLTCDGPFRMMFVGKVATLEDNVRLEKPNDGAPPDRLVCDTLSIYFNDKLKQSPSDKKSPASLDLQLKRIIALGAPATVDAPSRSAEIRAHRLEYDFDLRQFHLDSPKNSMFRDGELQIETKRLDCRTTPDGDILFLEAVGAGRLLASTEKARNRIAAYWNQRLSLRPDKHQKLLSIIGAARVETEISGRIDAGRIDVWLDELKTPRGKPDYQPNRALAQDDVSFLSPRLSGKTQRLEAWFVNEPTQPDQQQDARADDLSAGSARSLTKPASKTPIAIQGELLRLKIARRGKETIPTDVSLLGNARLTQRATDGRTDPLLDVFGAAIQFRGDTPATGVVTVSGTSERWAIVGAEGMKIEGSTVQLDRKANRMWIDGPGRMKLPMKKDLQGRPLAQPQTVHVEWHDSMAFDGRAITLQGRVDARGSSQHLETDWLQVVLVKRIDFQRPPKRNATTEVLGFAADRGVRLRNKTYEEGQLVSIERFELRDIQINQVTGKIAGAGPGWFATVRRNDNSSGLASVGFPATNKGSKGSAKPLVNLQVTFQGDLIGDAVAGARDRSIEFRNQVAALYIPIDGWIEPSLTDKKQKLPEDAVELECDVLAIEQTSQQNGKWDSTLRAKRNTRVFGELFSAKADQIVFVQAKDQLILKGEGRGKAEIRYQLSEGSSVLDTAAKQIIYNTKTKRVISNWGESFEWTNLESMLPPAREAAEAMKPAAPITGSPVAVAEINNLQAACEFDSAGVASAPSNQLYESYQSAGIVKS